MTEETALAERLPPGKIEVLKSPALLPSVDSVLEQNALVDELLKKAMVKDKHYGVIPGTGTKPTLLKPGAEALLRLFRLSPRYRVTETPLGADHFKLDIVCELSHRVTGEFWGEGVATASTKESKYRWRYNETPTGKSVPKEYWAKRDKAVIGGPGFSAKKINDKWEIVKRGEKIENPDIADQWNTVKKMGKKRALVDAILTATGASAVFTQDIEEMETSGQGQGAPAAPSKATTEPPQAQDVASEPKADPGGWDGSKEVSFGKHKGKTWAEIPDKSSSGFSYLEYIVDKMEDPAKGMASQEIGRRAILEGEAVEVVDGELVDDSELQERFK